MIALAVLIVLLLRVVVLSAGIRFGNQISLYQDRLIAIMNTLAPYIPSYEGLSVQNILRNLVVNSVSFMISVLNGLLNTGTTIGIVMLTAAFLLIDAVKYGPMGFLEVIARVIVVDVVSENIIFPSLAKKGLNLSPAVLFLSFLYSSFVLGPLGVLLSVPLYGLRKTRT